MQHRWDSLWRLLDYSAENMRKWVRVLIWKRQGVRRDENGLEMPPCAYRFQAEHDAQSFSEEDTEQLVVSQQLLDICRLDHVSGVDNWDRGCATGC